MRVKKDIEMELLVCYTMLTRLAEQQEEMSKSLYFELTTKYSAKAAALKWVLEESEKCLL